MADEELKFSNSYLMKIFKCSVKIKSFCKSTCWKCGEEIELIFARRKSDGKNLKGFFCQNCGRTDYEEYLNIV